MKNILYYSAILFFCSCGSKELSKDEAQKIISTNYLLPRLSRIAIEVKFDDYGWPPAKYRQLEKSGIFILEPACSQCRPQKYQALVGSEGEKYWLQNGMMNTSDGRKRVIVFKGYTISVKNISVSSNGKDKTAQAMVTLQYTNPSPIQAVFDPLKTNEVQTTIFFRLFDDGWKLIEDANIRKLIPDIVIPQQWASGGKIELDDSFMNYYAKGDASID